MKLADLPKPVQEMLGYYEALRRLGFESTEIFAFRYAHGSMVGIELHAQDRIYVCVCGETDLGATDFQALWEQVVEAYNGSGFTEDELKINFEGSRAYTEAEKLVKGLMNRGFWMPNVAPEAELTRRKRASA